MKHTRTIIVIFCLVFLAGSPGWGQEEKAGRDISSFYTKSWAVIIGINDYLDFPALDYAVNDARAVEARFQSMGFEVISLKDLQATKENIMHVLKHELPEKVGKNDRLVIFYAGHGAAGVLPTGEQMGFIIPSDAKSIVDGRRIEIIGGEVVVDDYETFPDKANFISVEDIRAISDNVKAKHIFYIIDGCYSGFMDPAAYSKINASRRIGVNVTEVDETSRGLFLSVEQEETIEEAIPERESSRTTPLDYLDVITSRDTVQVMTAGSSGEEVYEKSGHGIFTYYLLRALDGIADFNKDCVVRASELGTYLKQSVQEASASSQSPLFNRISGEGELIFIPPICKPIQPIHLQPPTSDKEWTKTDAYKGPKGSKYKKPVQVIVDNEENLYVLDSKLQKLFRFDATGKYIPAHFAQSPIATPRVPGSMAVQYGGDLWVFYAWQGKKKKKQKAPGGQIAIYHQDGTLAENWSGGTEPLGACVQNDGTLVDFPSEALIALDIGDNLIIVDQKKGVITKCDRNGKLLHQWGKYEKHEIIKDINRYKTVAEPQGLAVDMFGYVYVTDTKGHGIQKFFDGEWIPSWPNVKGNKPYFFDSPHGITVDNNLYVYVADTKNHRIKKYTSRGEKLLTYWGKKKAKKGKKYGEFNMPTDVAVSWDNTTIFVSDSGNKRIQKFVIE